jgi:hypothetical protein
MNTVLEFAAGLDSRLVLFVLLLVMDAWAGTMVFLSNAGRRDKALWIFILAACPIIGCIFWFVFGPKRRRNAT